MVRDSCGYQCPRPRAALCLLGRIRGLAYTAASLAEHLILPLSADLFVYLPLAFLREAPEADVRELLALPGLVEITAEEENVTAFLKREMRPIISGATADEVLEWTRMVNGNWLGGLLQGDHGGARVGSGLMQMHSWRRCMQMVDRREASGTPPYDWIVQSRFDLFWEAPHLPLALFSKDAVWIPDGQDWGGYNDRHALIPRGPSLVNGTPSPMEMYLDAWRFVTEGKAAVVLHNAFQNLTNCKPREEDPEDEETRPPCLNSEAWLWLRLSALRVRVSRYPSLSWITCGVPSSASEPRRGTQHFLANCSAQGTPWRYPDEHTAVVATAHCLRGSGGGEEEEVAEVDAGHAAAAPSPLHLQRLRVRVRRCWCPRGVLHADMRLMGAEEEERYRHAMALCLEREEGA